MSLGLDTKKPRAKSDVESTEQAKLLSQTNQANATLGFLILVTEGFKLPEGFDLIGDLTCYDGRKFAVAMKVR